MKPKMLLLTKHYPYGNGEPFVGNEVRFLKNYFSIQIITDSYSDGESRLMINGGIDVYRVPNFDWPTRKERVKALYWCITSLELFGEIAHVIVRYRLKCRTFLRDILNQIVFGEKYYSYLYEHGVLNTEEAAIIYSFWNVYKVVPFLLRNNKNWKVVSRIHGVDFYNERNEHGRQPLKSLNKKLDRLYFLSQYAEEYYENQFGHLPNQCKRILPLGVENDYTDLSKKGNNEFLIVSCSRVVQVKRLERIVEALEMISEFQVSWTHIGDGELMENLQKEIANKLEKKNNIQVRLLGNQNNDNVKDYYYYNNPDCFVLVSDSEGTPVSIMEALSFGIPVISYSVGSIPEMLEGTGNILIPPNSTPRELSDAIKRIYMMPNNEKKVLRSKNRELWNQKYNGEKNTKKMAKDMLSLLR